MRLLVVFLFLSNILSAQPTGTIRFLIEQNNGFFEVLVNDTLVISKYRDTLPVGVYTAQIWSPGFEIVDTSFVIKENIETTHYLKMKRSEEYVQRSKMNVKRNKKRTLLFRLPLTLSLVSYANLGFQFVKIVNEKDSLELYAQQYSGLGSLIGIQRFKNELIELESSFNITRRKFYSSLSVSMLLTASTILGNIYLNKKFTSVPLLNKVSPFRNKLSLNCGFNSLSLTLKL